VEETLSKPPKFAQGLCKIGSETLKCKRIKTSLLVIHKPDIDIILIKEHWLAKS